MMKYQFGLMVSLSAITLAASLKAEAAGRRQAPVIRREPAWAPRSTKPYYVSTTSGTSASGEKAPLIVFLHGAGSEPNNGVLERMATAMKEVGVAANFVSLPHETDSDAIRNFLNEQQGQPVIFAGHSIGGYKAIWLAHSYPHLVRANILINPAEGVGSEPVPTLLLRGTHDGYSSREGGKNVLNVAVEGADHSLRFRNPAWQFDKPAYEQTPETREMNRVVARQVGIFLQALEATGR